jgi:hypothetical protein
MSAGEQARIGAEIGEQRDCVFDGFRAVIGKGPWNHDKPPRAEPWIDLDEARISKAQFLFLEA